MNFVGRRIAAYKEYCFVGDSLLVGVFYKLWRRMRKGVQTDRRGSLRRKINDDPINRAKGKDGRIKLALTNKPRVGAKYSSTPGL